MPVHGPPDPISAYHGREEALKTSWVNSNYPAVPSPLPALGVPFFSSSKVDTNGMAGLNPDGTWQLSKLYNWDTWKCPLIEYVHVHQFDIDGQARVAWKASNGDIFRTGWLVMINTSGNYGTGAQYHVRYAPEFNPQGDDKLRWSRFFGVGNDRDVQAASITGGWWSVEVFGGYSHDIAEPSANTIADPSTGEFNPSAIFSCVVNANPGDEIAAWVIPIDGRQFHTLPMIDNPTEYDTSSNSTGANSGKSKNGSYADNYSYYDSRLSNGVIKIFGGIGGVGAEDIASEQVSLRPDNLYSFYLRGLEIYHWVYMIRADDPDIGHPYYPDDVLPSDHYYETSSTDDFDQFALGKWVRFQGSKMIVNGLDPETEYKAFVTTFSPSDIQRYAGSTTPAFSAPSSERGFEQTTFQTTQEPFIEVTISSITLLPVSEPNYDFEWDTTGDASDIFYEFQYRVFNSDGSLFQDWQPPQAIENKENWETSTNPKKARVKPNLFLNPGQTIKWQIRLNSVGSTPSGWSDAGEYTL